MLFLLFLVFIVGTDALIGLLDVVAIVLIRVTFVPTVLVRAFFVNAGVLVARVTRILVGIVVIVVIVVIVARAVIVGFAVVIGVFFLRSSSLILRCCLCCS